MKILRAASKISSSKIPTFSTFKVMKTYAILNNKRNKHMKRKLKVYVPFKYHQIIFVKESATIKREPVYTLSQKEIMLVYFMKIIT